MNEDVKINAIKETVKLFTEQKALFHKQTLEIFCALGLEPLT